MMLNNCSGEHGVFLALCTRCKPAGVGAELHPAAREQTKANRLL